MRYTSRTSTYDGVAWATPVDEDGIARPPVWHETPPEDKGDRRKA
jgi:hypothetical protein